MSDDFVFEAPKRPHAATRWADRLLALAEHPGEWVNATKTYGLSPNSLSVAALIRGAAAQAGLRVEVITEGQKTDAATLYVRVLKEES